jgi:zinc transport system substrate-binding protein
MRRLFSCLLAFAACARAGLADDAPLRIVASFYPVYVHTLNIAANMPGVSVDILAPPQTGCLHEYEATPEDMIKIASADILVVNGGGMESFISKVTDSNPRCRIVDASKGLTLISDAHGTNAHIWLSVLGSIQQVRNIADQLSAADPARAVAYRANADAYMDNLGRLRVRMLDGLKPFKGTSIVTFHEAFPYFANEFGLHIAAVIEREPGSSPGARELADLIDTVRRARVRTLFIEPQYPPAAAETVARETGAKLLTLDPAVMGPLNDAKAYITIMDKNLETLTGALASPGHAN